MTSWSTNWPRNVSAGRVVGLFGLSALRSRLTINSWAPAPSGSRASSSPPAAPNSMSADLTCSSSSANGGSSNSRPKFCGDGPAAGRTGEVVRIGVPARGEPIANTPPAPRAPSSRLRLRPPPLPPVPLASMPVNCGRPSTTDQSGDSLDRVTADTGCDDAGIRVVAMPIRSGDVRPRDFDDPRALALQTHRCRYLRAAMTAATTFWVASMCRVSGAHPMATRPAEPASTARRRPRDLCQRFGAYGP